MMAVLKEVGACLFSLLLLLLLLPSMISSSVDPQFEACAPKWCGGQRIGYPFWIDGVQQPYCGFPGFNLSCDAAANRTILKIPHNDYAVQRIFYNNQSLRISLVAPPLSSCVPSVQNMTLPDGRFALASDPSELLLFTNCSTEVPAELALRDCSRAAGNGSGLVAAAVGGRGGMLEGQCASAVVVPVELYGDEGKGSNGGLGGDWRKYEEVVGRGFLLKWTAADCSVCEQTGGRCGFDEASYHFKCYCPDRPHAWHCVPPPSMSFSLSLATPS